jgi:uncharacterized PurR-regulated membrane protein YhhQ (DUF165 family)
MKNGMKASVLAGLYLAAVVAANLVIARYGAKATIPVAFLLVGFTLSTRDALHLLWGSSVKRNMALLILIGGALTYALNAGAGRVALASVAAFAISEALDAIVFEMNRGKPRVVASDRSNFAGAAADSLIFLPLAFGGFPVALILLQFAAKFLGGALWARWLNYQAGRTATLDL